MKSPAEIFVDMPTLPVPDPLAVGILSIPCVNATSYVEGAFVSRLEDLRFGSGAAVLWRGDGGTRLRVAPRAGSSSPIKAGLGRKAALDAANIENNEGQVEG